ncbi:AAA family ATPase [Candidatus Dependentiae bacterium]|nr:AAA family ATPase [Candidatus Dependentiae bacterium]
MKKIATATHSFRTLIEKGFIYVDKTKIIYDLLAGDPFYFLSRPRRFGKTLLISTLQELFMGNRDFFKDCWINSSDYTWERYPVILLDFSTMDGTSPENFEKSLAYDLDLKAKEFTIDTSGSSSPIDKLKALVQGLAKKNKVVILIDEYDYPIVNNIENPQLLNENLKIVNNFFTAIKGLSKDFVHAVFVTGVSPIPKTSAYSGMNILNNISLKPRAATLLGYTKEELLTYFSHAIHQLTVLEQTSQEKLLDKIQLWYNGYRFSENEEKVYNPFSLHYLFEDKKFANYWFSSATPKFLLSLLKKNSFNLQTIEHGPFWENSLTSLDHEEPQLSPLLFQTGYLTISSYNKKTDSYELDYPNYEVKESYNLALIVAITRTNENKIKSLIEPLREALLENEMQEVCSLLKIIFAQIPHQIGEHHENFYHTMVQSFFILLGFETESEISTNRGRIDLAVFTKKFTYIFEFKVRTSPETALKQIEDRAYYERYLSSPKIKKESTVVLVGMTFSKRYGEATVSCECKKLS